MARPSIVDCSFDRLFHTPVVVKIPRESRCEFSRQKEWNIYENLAIIARFDYSRPLYYLWLYSRLVKSIGIGLARAARFYKDIARLCVSISRISHIMHVALARAAMTGCLESRRHTRTVRSSPNLLLSGEFLGQSVQGFLVPSDVEPSVMHHIGINGVPPQRLIKQANRVNDRPI